MSRFTSTEGAIDLANCYRSFGALKRVRKNYGASRLLLDSITPPEFILMLSGMTIDVSPTPKSDNGVGDTTGFHTHRPSVHVR